MTSGNAETCLSAARPMLYNESSKNRLELWVATKIYSNDPIIYDELPIDLNSIALNLISKHGDMLLHITTTLSQRWILWRPSHFQAKMDIKF